MKVIAFDGSILGAGPITGVAGSFLTTLRRYVAADRFEGVLLLPLGSSFEMPGIRCLPCLPKGRWRRLRMLRTMCRQVGAAALHSPLAAVPLAAVPLRSNCPVIATVHDVPWLYPALRGEPGCRLSQRLALQLAMRFADAVILPSAATLRDAQTCVNLDETRVAKSLRVIPHGVEAPAELAATNELCGPFLVMGDDRPRKNTARVRRAHDRAREDRPGLPDLQFIGPAHGYVDESTKWSRLRGSRALLHLSLLEGFGLPVLEAFAHGVPVVCSDRGSLREIAADAALIVDPEDVGAMAEAMIRIDQDQALRDDLRERGVERARTFTPDRTAEAWRELHRELAS